MNENIGKNLKTLAQICGWLYLAAGTIGAIYIWTDWRYDFIEGLYALGIGLGLSLSAWPLYGFAQLVEDVASLRYLAAKGESKRADSTPDKFCDLPDL